MGKCASRILHPEGPKPRKIVKAFDVFVSRTNEDELGPAKIDFADFYGQWISKILDEEGFKVFFDRTNMHRLTSEKLEYAVASCKMLVSVMTERSFKDPWGMMQENRTAKLLDIPILPFVDGDTHDSRTIAAWAKDFPFAFAISPVRYSRKQHELCKETLIHAVKDILNDGEGQDTPRNKLPIPVPPAGKGILKAAPVAPPAGDKKMDEKGGGKLLAGGAKVGKGEAEEEEQEPEMRKLKKGGVRIGGAETRALLTNYEDGRTELEEVLTSTFAQNARKMLGMAQPLPTASEPRHREAGPVRSILKKDTMKPGKHQHGHHGRDKVAEVRSEEMQLGIAKVTAYLNSLPPTIENLEPVIKCLWHCAENQGVALLALSHLWHVTTGKKSQPATKAVVAVAKAEHGVSAIHKALTRHRTNMDVTAYAVGLLFRISEHADGRGQRAMPPKALQELRMSLADVAVAMQGFRKCKEIQRYGCGAIARVLGSSGDENKKSTDKDTGEVVLQVRGSAARLCRKAGGVPAVLHAISTYHDDITLQYYACLAVQVLTSQDDKRKVAVAGGIRFAMRAMQRFAKDRRLQGAAIGVLRCLGMNCIENKNDIAEAGGVRLIVDAMRRWPDIGLLQEHSVAALCNLASKCAPNKKQICDFRGLEITVAAMKRFHSNAELQLQGCGLLHNLAYDSELKEKVLDAGAQEVAEAALGHKAPAVQKIGEMLLKQLQTAPTPANDVFDTIFAMRRTEPSAEGKAAPKKGGGRGGPSVRSQAAKWVQDELASNVSQTTAGDESGGSDSERSDAALVEEDDDDDQQENQDDAESVAESEATEDEGEDDEARAAAAVQSVLEHDDEEAQWTHRQEAEEVQPTSWRMRDPNDIKQPNASDPTGLDAVANWNLQLSKGMLSSTHRETELPDEDSEAEAERLRLRSRFAAFDASEEEHKQQQLALVAAEEAKRHAEPEQWLNARPLNARQKAAMATLPSRRGDADAWKDALSRRAEKEEARQSKTVARRLSNAALGESGLSRWANVKADTWVKKKTKKPAAAPKGKDPDPVKKGVRFSKKPEYSKGI
mmetsp:Transcript_31940/g.82772  ORF Transcript_31940/g.82772 Transcript_31940/m.82772 type:complete len:1062 (-) Transcript_31940:202-3387(-)